MWADIVEEVGMGSGDDGMGAADDALRAQPFSAYSALALPGEGGVVLDGEALEVEVDAESARCLLRWLEACGGVEGAARVSILSHEREVIAALMVSEGRICFGSSSVNVDFVSDRVGQHGELFQRTLREVRLRSVRLGGLSSSERLAQRDEQELQGRLRGLMARLLLFIAMAVRGVEGELPAQLTVRRPIDGRYVQDRPCFIGVSLYLEAMQQAFGVVEDSATQLLEGLVGWTEEAWVLARRSAEGVPCAIGAQHPSRASWEDVQAMEALGFQTERSSRWACKEASRRVVSVIHADGELWCCAVGVSRVVLFRLPAARLGLVVAELQRREEGA